jgi:hypothetical protein
MRFVWIFLCLCLVEFNLRAEEPSARSSWPHSETNQYEIIGGSEIGISIPLPDFAFKTGNKAHQLYLHRLYPYRSLVVTIEGFDEPTTLKEYGNLFIKSWMQKLQESSSLKMTEDKEIVSGSTGSIPMLRRTWKNERETIYQLYVIRDKIGICLTAFCDPPKEVPEEVVEHENKYWTKLFDELTQAVDFTGEQADIIVK